MINSDEHNLLSVKDVAELLGVAPITVRRRIADGSLASFRVGTGPRPAVRVARSDLVEYVGRCTDLHTP